MTSARIYMSPPDIGALEREFILEALESNWVAPMGPSLDAFEREVAERTGVGHAVGLASGTAGLHLALVHLGVGVDDTVLVPTLTFISTANVVRYVGAQPAFIDSEESTWNMDTELLVEDLHQRAAAGTLPKAVVAVDIYGQCPDFGPLTAACTEYQIPLVEDAAEALGATCRGRPAGSLGDVGVFSFNGNKIITTSGGGMFLTDDAGAAAHVRYLATQARLPAPHYEHRDLGFNYRLSNVLAALGRAQLRSLDQKIARRRAVHTMYQENLSELPGVSFLNEAPHGRSTHWLTCIRIDPDAARASRDDVQRALEQADIEARPTWKPMHLQPLYAGNAVRNRGAAERIFREGLCLPSGSSLSDADVWRVASTLREQLG